MDYNALRLYAMAIGYLEVYLLDRTAAAPMIHYQNPFGGPQISIIKKCSPFIKLETGSQSI